MTQVHWTNPVSGDFGHGADWAGGVPPRAGDQAILDAPGSTTYTVTVSINETVAGLQTLADATLAVTGARFDATSGTDGGANAGLISVNAGADLALSGMVDNSGAIELAGARKGAHLSIGAFGATFSGGGDISLADGGVGTSEIAGGLLTNVDNTLSGSIQIFSSGLINYSAGVVDATGVRPSEIDALSADGIVNSGLIEATGSGGVFIVSDMIDQSRGGVLAAAGGSTVLLLTSVVGGSLETAAGGLIEADTASFDGASSAVTNLGLVAVAQAGALTLMGTIDNIGTISLTDAKHLASLIVSQATPTLLTGGGTVFLGHDGHNVVDGAGATAMLINTDNTIAGAGLLGDRRLGLVNQTAGVIDANGANALILDTGSGSVANGGLIEATGAAGLTIRNSRVDGSSGGVILAADGSHVGLQGATILGGRLKSMGDGVIQTFGSGNVLDGLAASIDNQATIDVLGASTLTLKGAIDNAGTIELSAQGAAAVLSIGASNATLSGGGQISLLGDPDNEIVGTTAAATLTNLDNTISGAGQLGDGTMTLVNGSGGRIVASLAGGLVIDTGAQTIANAGQIESAGAGGLTIVGAIDNTGVLDALVGILTVNGAVSGAGRATIDGGTLVAAGAFSQRVAFGAAGGGLELAHSQSYGGTVSGFSPRAALDLDDIAFVGPDQASFSGFASGGVLTVTDGTHAAHISLAGDYLGTTFATSSDGHGGTMVVERARTHRFVAATASLGGCDGLSTSASHEGWRLPPPNLARPQVSVA